MIHNRYNAFLDHPLSAACQHGHGARAARGQLLSLAVVICLKGSSWVRAGVDYATMHLGGLGEAFDVASHSQSNRPSDLYIAFCHPPSTSCGKNLEAGSRWFHLNPTSTRSSVHPGHKVGLCSFRSA